jgi:hypothetical protein
MPDQLKANLVGVPNVWNSCLRVLRARGYDLSITCNAPPGLNAVERLNHVTWLARKGGYQLVANNPIELLGLAGVYEFKNQTSDEAYWWVVEGADIVEELYSSVGLGLRPSR